MAQMVEAERISDEILDWLKGEPGLLASLIEFRIGRLSGKIEIHWSQGGIAKVYGKPERTYK